MITLPIAELKPALVGLGKIIRKTPTLPVLGMVKIERTKDGWTLITGTDLDSYVTAPRPVDDVQDDDENEPDDVVLAQDTPELPDDA